MSTEPTMQEMILDLKVIDNTSSFVGHCIRNLQANSTIFRPKEYADGLIEALTENDEIHWDKLTDMALPVINRAPGISVLLGIFKPSVEQITKAVAVKKNSQRAKNKIGNKQTAEDVSYCSHIQT